MTARGGSGPSGPPPDALASGAPADRLHGRPGPHNADPAPVEPADPRCDEPRGDRGATPTGTVLHAACVAVGDRACLILGPSGSGKSALALDLVALGATLVADDRVRVVRGPSGAPRLAPPAAIAGRIEARHLGLLTLPHRPEAEAVLAIDLGTVEAERLPPRRRFRQAGLDIPLLLAPPHGRVASALFVMLAHGAVR